MPEQKLVDITTSKIGPVQIPACMVEPCNEALSLVLEARTHGRTAPDESWRLVRYLHGLLFHETISAAKR